MTSSNRSGPQTRIRRVGRVINRVIVHAPWLWPVIRGPVQAYFEERAPGWDDRTAAGSPGHLAPRAAGALRAGAPERVLDVGTGTGEGALLLAREFPSASVRGVDISKDMVRTAQAKVGLDPEGRIAFRVADASSL